MKFKKKTLENVIAYRITLQRCSHSYLFLILIESKKCFKKTFFEIMIFIIIIIIFDVIDCQRKKILIVNLSVCCLLQRNIK